MKIFQFIILLVSLYISGECSIYRQKRQSRGDIQYEYDYMNDDSNREIFDEKYFLGEFHLEARVDNSTVKSEYCWDVTLEKDSKDWSGMSRMYILNDTHLLHETRYWIGGIERDKLVFVIEYLKGGANGVISMTIDYADESGFTLFWSKKKQFLVFSRNCASSNLLNRAKVFLEENKFTGYKLINSNCNKIIKSSLKPTEI